MSAPSPSPPAGGERPGLPPSAVSLEDPIVEDPTAPQTGPRARRRAAHGWIASLFFLLSWVVYNANLRTPGSYDGLAASLIPFGIWRGDGVLLDRHGGKLPPEVGYSIVRSKTGHWVSLYPIVTPLLVTPLYVPTLWWGELRTDHPKYGNVARAVMEKVSASTLAALSVSAVYLLLLGRASPRVAAGLTVAYAFGTSTWAVSSQQLQQHAAGQLLLASCLLLLVRARPPGLAGIGFQGLLAGLLTANRPQNVFFSAALACIVLKRHGRRSWPFFVLAGLVAAALVSYNLVHFSSVTGGYGDYRLPGGGRLEATFPQLSSIAGLLISNRGLLTFSPFFLLLLFQAKSTAGPRDENAILAAAWLSTVLLYASYPGWSGGYTYGPRYLADGLPLLTLLLAGPVERLRSREGRVFLVVSTSWAVVLQAIGAFCFPGGDSGNERIGFWTASRSSPVLAARAGLQPPQFLPLLAPSLVMDGPLSPEDARSDLRWVQPPPGSCRSGERLDLRVAVTNHGRKRWSSFGGWFARDAVKLVAWWTGADGRSAPGSRPTEEWLAAALQPGETVVVGVRPRTPPTKGSYRLHVGILQTAGPEPITPPDRAEGDLRALVQVTPGGTASDFSVLWGGAEGPSEILAGRRARYRVRLRNGSETPWTSAVRLSYHWRRADGVELSLDGERANLVPLAEQDGFGVYAIDVLAIVPPAEYQLEFDLVEEGVDWFAARGSSPLLVDVVVRDAGPPVGTFPPLPDGAFRADVDAPSVPAKVRAGEAFDVAVTVRNRSAVVFPADGRIEAGGRVNVSYRWLDTAGNALVGDGARTALPAPLGPGESVTVLALVVAPTSEGERVLEIDLVQEGVDWFRARGSRPFQARVGVSRTGEPEIPTGSNRSRR